MRILGIETSCDETAAAVVEDGRKIISNVVFSQEKYHQPFKGIVPEIASRAHLEKINRVVEQALEEAKSGRRKARSENGERFAHRSSLIARQIDAIAVTIGPGLVGSLLVGKMTAEALGWSWDVPMVGVNHIEAHLFSALLAVPDLVPPFIGLVVSGGHTDLIVAEDFGKYKILGRTRDDAAGECFDKAANILGLGYPGGPEIENFAKKGDSEKMNFSRPYLRGSWDFSFSGLKTAVLYCWQRTKSGERRAESKETQNLKLRNAVEKESDSTFIPDICASLQSAIVDVLVEKSILAAKKYGMKKIVVGGGVSANSFFRKVFFKRAGEAKVEVYFPSKNLSTDNAAMVAAVGYYKMKFTDKSLEFSEKIENQKREAGDGIHTLSQLSTLNSQLNIDPSMPLRNWGEVAG